MASDAHIQSTEWDVWVNSFTVRGIIKTRSLNWSKHSRHTISDWRPTAHKGLFLCSWWKQMKLSRPAHFWSMGQMSDYSFDNEIKATILFGTFSSVVSCVSRMLCFQLHTLPHDHTTTNDNIANNCSKTHFCNYDPSVLAFSYAEKFHYSECAVSVSERRVFIIITQVLESAHLQRGFSFLLSFSTKFQTHLRHCWLKLVQEVRVQGKSVTIWS